ncbi:amidohydrolase family protein [Sphingopyxis sp. 550A]
MAEPWVDSHIHLIDRSRLHYSWLDGVSEEWEAILGDYSPIIRDFPAEEFLKAALPEGLTKLVHVEAAFGAEPVAETRWLQGEAERLGLPMAIVGRADLADPDVGALLDRHLAYPAFRGVRMLWGLANAPADDFRRGFSALVDRDLIFEEPATFEQFALLGELAGDFPSARIILGHCGLPLSREAGDIEAWRRALGGLAKHPNISCKISGLAMTDHRWTFDRMKTVTDAVIEEFGVERSFMGSNWPVESLYFSTYGELIAVLRDLISDRSSDERRAIMSDTASKIFRI